MKKVIPFFLVCIIVVIVSYIAASESAENTALLSAKEVVAGIHSYIDSMTNEGYLHIYDEYDSRDLSLKSAKIYDDKVIYHKSEDVYSTCVDFVTDDGMVTYDIDFWMKKNDNGGLDIYTTKVHKKDGVSRFTYDDSDIVSVK